VVALTGLPYPVTVAPGALDQLGEVIRSVTSGGAGRVMIISDATVAGLYGERMALAIGADIMTAVLDEKHKTRAAWGLLTDRLLEQGFGRDTTLVALGGGVVGDVVGFVAATYMRGVRYVQVPTTLLAMVDASVGGKTGVDTPAGKNLVGAFHQPSAVVIDPLVLRTLTIEHFRAGFAEIIKHGVVADADFLATVGSYAAGGGASNATATEPLTPLIARGVQIKADIVARDERESGLRKVLNFGHTIGHAIEAASNYETLHGNAVAIGMVAEARIAERMGVAAPGTAAEIEHVCRAASLPVSLPEIPLDVLLGFTRADKKVRGGRVEYALPERIGAMAGSERGWAIPVDDDTIREALTK
jgi:3-dehydroquinate synthase